MLSQVTLTGADTNTDIDKLIEISDAFPFVEWAILFSYGRMGTERYPTLEWITDFYTQTYNTSVRSSLHLCGKSVYNFMDGDSVICALANQFDRVQLNFNHNRLPIDTNVIDQRLPWALYSIITQHNENNKELSQAIESSHHHVLFDASGGEGKPLTVQTPIKDKYCGYAGGIGPDNVKSILDQLEGLHPVAIPYWIDMESSLRTNGEFDLNKCVDVLTIADEYYLR